MSKKGDLILIEERQTLYFASVQARRNHAGPTESFPCTLYRVASATREGDPKTVQRLDGSKTVLRVSGSFTRPRIIRVRQDAAEKLAIDRWAEPRDTARFTFENQEAFNKAMEPFVIKCQLAINAAKAAEKPGKYKMQYKASKTGHAPAFTDRDYERQAVAYARWLAERDGIEIPAEATAKIDWSGVTVDHDQITGRKLDKQRYERRVWEVDFSMRIELRNGYRFEKVASIRIPNWDHVRVPAVEEIDPEIAFLEAAE